jgi:hypothetical protein
MPVSKSTLKLSLAALEREFDWLRNCYDNPIPDYPQVKENYKKRLFGCWGAIRELEKELGIDIKDIPLSEKIKKENTI